MTTENVETDRFLRDTRTIPYPLRNDNDEEHQRLKQIHLCQLAFWGKNILAPISLSPSLIGYFILKMFSYLIIVDIGTGSGLWAKEVAEQYPTAKVIGTDISSVTIPNVPVNCEFKVENLLDGLGFANDSVDLVHSRLVISIFYVQ